MFEMILSNIKVFAIIGGFIIVIIAFMLWVLVSHNAWRKKAENTKEDGGDIWQEPEEKVIGARVLEKEIRDFHTGYKMPEYHIQYLVKFLMDEGNGVVYEVHEEVFNRINEGDTGNLVTLSGNFFDFGSGEEVSEE